MYRVVKKTPAHRTTGLKLKPHRMGPGYSTLTTSAQNLSAFMRSKKKRSSSLASKSYTIEVDAKWDKGLDH